MISPKPSLLSPHDMTWVCGTAAAAIENNLVTGVAALRRAVAAQRWTASALMFCSMPYRLTQTTLYESRKHCGPMQEPQNLRHALNQRNLFKATTLRVLEGFMLSMFPKKDILMEVSACPLANPTFNASVESIGKENRDWKIARYTSTNQLMTLYREQRERESSHICKEMSRLGSVVRYAWFCNGLEQCCGREPLLVGDW